MTAKGSGIVKAGLAVAAITCTVLGTQSRPAATAAALASVQGSVPPSNVQPCIDTHSKLLPYIPPDFYQIRGSAFPATLPGDIICANEITAPYPYRAWAFVYWVKQANGEFVQVSATIKINAGGTAPPGGRPVLSYAHPTPTGITDGCAPSHRTPTLPSYGPPLQDFLDNGFAVVGTDYIGLGMPEVHPYLVGKSEGAAVLAAARAAEKFAPAQASGPVIIYGHSQGGHAALFADWQAQDISYFAPGVDVRGVIASAPPTFLGEMASRVIAMPTDLRSVMFMVMAAGSWHRLYNFAYPDNVFTSMGQLQAQEASDPDRQDCYSLPPGIPPEALIQPGALPVEWTDFLGINTAPVGLLPASIPLLVVQGTDDQQVPYDVTLAAVRDICGSGVPVTFDDILGGDHDAPQDADSRLRNHDLVHNAIISWAKQVILGTSVENSCGSLPAG